MASCCSGVGADIASERLRIGLVRFYGRVQSVILSSRSGVRLHEPDGRELFSCEPEASITVSAEGGAVIASSGLEVRSAAGSFVTACSREPAGTIRVQALRQPAREYRGWIEVRPKPWGLLIVNVVALEDYLLGVVPAEMPSSYPMEAIKAQAVTARTYALANRGKHASDGYDLCDTDNCQIYGGVSAETAKAAEAVRATAGMVITYEGRPARVMYSGDCGGATQDPFEASPERRLPYLCGVTEPADMPHTAWEAALSLKDIENKLLAAGIKQAAGLTAIRASSRSSSGRVTEFELTSRSGTALVSGNKLRIALGAHVIKSLLLTVEQTPEGLVLFKGRGTGHGIGLCQVGAKWLASPPRNWSFDQILAHYFPGTQIAAAADCAGPVSETRNIRRSAKPSTVTDAKPKTATDAASPARSDSRDAVPFDIRVDAPEGL